MRGANLDQVIAGYLERADLSVHPIGAYYGVIPEAQNESLQEIENALAAERSGAGELTRLVWMPSDLKVRDKRQQAFVDNLNDDPDLTDRDSVLETTLEELKSVIGDKLEPKDEPPVAEDVPASQRVYLICDEVDDDAAQGLDDWLYKQDLDVWLPLRSGSEEDRRKVHEKRLRIADGILVFCGEAGEAWLVEIMLDLAEAARRPRASAVYLAGPEARFKERYRTRDADKIITAFGAFEPDCLESFLAALGVRRQGGDA